MLINCKVSRRQLPISLGIPITISILSKVEYRSFVDKILARIEIRSSKSISHAGRVTLINLCSLACSNFGASIFIVPREVVDQVTRATGGE